MIRKILVLSILCSLIIFFWPGEPSKAPSVSFHYNAAIDNYLCQRKSKARILPNWHSELTSKLPQLEQVWNQLGPRLLAETSKLTGKPFPYSHYNVSVFLCPDLPGLSFPIIMVPVRMYLKHAVIQQTWGKNEFVDMVYHELLHLYVARALHWNLWTPLLKKHHNEALNTKIHLHLFALQKAVYFNLGLQKEWQIVVEENKQFPTQYSRAIAIVEEDGYQPYINELRSD